MKAHSLLVALCFAVSPLTSYAANESPSGDTPRQKPVEDQAPTVKSQEASTFFGQVHVLNLAEVKIGRIAAKSSQNKDVQALAKMLISDHIKAEMTLLNTLRSSNAGLLGTRKLPEVVRLKRKLFEVIKTLKKTPAADFDAIFIQEMVTGHQEAIDLVTDARDKIQDDSVKSLVEALLPSLERHLKMAQDLQAQGMD